MLVCVDLFMMAIMTGVKWYLIVVLIFMSLIANGTEHLFICLWNLCMSSLEKCLFKSFAQYIIFLSLNSTGLFFVYVFKITSV